MGARCQGEIARKMAVIICSWLLLPAHPLGQNLKTRFFTPKSTYLVGEPIFVTYEFSNDGNKPVWVSSRFGDPCFEQSPITVADATPGRHGWETALNCGPTGYGGSCLSSRVEIKQGQLHPGRIFVNHYYLLDQPGNYEIRIDRNVSVTTGPIPSVPGETVEVMGNVDIQVVNAAKWELESAFQPFLKDLASPDSERRSQGVQAVTEMAQPFLEQTILDLSRNPSDVWASIEGLYKINTAKARDRLAELARHDNQDGVRERAMQALAALGDKQYLPLFFRLARNLKGYEQNLAIESTGLLGGDGAVQFLSSFLGSPDPQVRGAAVQGLAGTSSRTAVAPLIRELRDPDANVRNVVNAALAQLTHRSTASNAPDFAPNPGLDFQKWLGWWLEHGRNATIYGPTDCAEPIPLS